MTEEERKKTEVIAIRLNEKEAEDLNNFMRDHNYNSRSDLLKELIKYGLHDAGEIIKLRAEAEDLKKKNGDLNKKIEDLNSEIQKMKEENSSLRMKESSLRKNGEEIRHLEKKVRKLRSQNNQLGGIIAILIISLILLIAINYGSLIYHFLSP